MKRLAALLLAGAAIVGACSPGPSDAPVPVAEPTPTPPRPDVTSEGGVLYARHCAECHGEAFEGGSGPPLVGQPFTRGFQTVFDLFKYVQSTMPMNAPDSLTETQYLAILESVLDRRRIEFARPLLRADTATIALAEDAATTSVVTVPPVPSPVGTPVSHPPPASTVVEQAAATGNTPPSAPELTDPIPGPNGDISPYFVWFETGPFSDPDLSDRLTATQFEVLDATLNTPVWHTTLEGPAARADLQSGTFIGPLAGRLGLEMGRVYAIRARVRDGSGDSQTEWSPWSSTVLRIVAAPVTGERPSSYPRRVSGAQAGTLTWTGPAGQPIELPAGLSQPSSVEILAGRRPLFTITAHPGVAVQIAAEPPGDRLESLVVRITSGDAEVLPVPDSTLRFVDMLGREVNVHLPGLALGPNQTILLSVATTGSTFWEPDDVLDGVGLVRPLLASPARHTPNGWLARSGYRVERIAGGLRFPVHLVFDPDAPAGAEAVVAYITELSGSIKGLTRAGALVPFADGLLNYDPAAPPVSLPGENGLSGIVLDPESGDLFASLVFERDGQLFNAILRIGRQDDGAKAGGVQRILAMDAAPTSASHQIHALTIGPDGKLYANVGNAFSADQSQHLDTFNGKILRLNLDGSAPSDNPFYDPDRPSHPRSYIFATAIRNAFGATWSAADGQLYISENGEGLDRIARVTAGLDLGYDGEDASLVPQALRVFGPPAHAPTGLAALNGRQFPAPGGTLYMATSGRNFVRGPQATGKRVWQLSLEGSVVAEPISELVAYAGEGRSSISGLAFGPDGLYFLDLFPEHPAGGDPTAGDAALWRIVYVGDEN